MLAGFTVAFALVLGLLYVVGIGAVVETLSSADPLVVVAIFLVALGWMAAWSYSLHLVLAILDVATSLSRSFVVYTNVLFANNAAPFSIVGAEPIAALFVSRATRADYETSLAAVASVDVLNFLPAPALAIVGLVYVAVTTVLGDRLTTVALTLAGLSLAFAAAGVAGWRYRHSLERLLVGGVLRFERAVARIVPGVERPTREHVEDQLRTVVSSLERVAAERRVLVVGLAFSTLGWVLQASVLWLALLAVGHRVSLAVPLVVAPLAMVTDVVPLPGGVGSVDAVLVVLVVATTGITPPVATAAVLIHRSATFLFPLVLGGATTAAIQVRRTE